MYSVVLATMLAAGSTTPDWHHRSRCGGFAGCHGCYSSCYGGYGAFGGYGGYGGYACGGYSCFACSQPACHCTRPLFHRHHQVNYGCYCSNYCSSYCSGAVSYGCYCSGSVSYGCYCSGGGGQSSPQVVPVPSANSEVEALRREVERLRQQLKKSEKIPSPKKEEEISVPVTSRVTVSLPSDARLWVESVECPLTSSVRSFNTPPLNANQRYFYNLKVEVVRDGLTVSESQRVLIVPGEEVRVDFNNRSVAAR